MIRFAPGFAFMLLFGMLVLWSDDPFARAEYFDDYVDKGEKGTPLFRAVSKKTKQLTGREITRIEVYRIVKRRTRAAGILSPYRLPYLSGHRNYAVSQKRW